MKSTHKVNSNFTFFIFNSSFDAKMNIKNIETIIWDWNGTLLNDTEACRNIINDLLHDRGIKPLSKKKYKKIFTFPVKEYYIKAGFDFDKENFKTPADAFIKEYKKHLRCISLHKNVESILNGFKQKGLKQIIISAMKQDLLMESVGNKGIQHFFDRISGLKTHYATNKLKNANQIIKEMKLIPSKCFLIGDTIHDHEVATALGSDCILIANGHQNIERLKKTGRKVLKNIEQLSEYFIN